MAAGQDAGWLIELIYAKRGPALFLGHLDVMRAFERAVRRAGLPVAHTQGYNPRPRLVFAAPLGVGASGDEERVCVALRTAVSPGTALRLLSRALPPGLPLASVRPLAAARFPAYHLIAWAEWEVTLAPPGPTGEKLDRLCADLLSRCQVPIQRQRGDAVREVDIRPGILALSAAGDALLRMRLTLAQGLSAKPLEVVAALGLPTGDEREPHPLVHRLRLAPAPD